MGAASFSKVLVGKDLAKEFRAAVEQSQYEYGHSYSGEIGMKDGFVNVGPLPSRMSVDRLLELIYALQDWQYQSHDWNQYGSKYGTKRPGKNPVPEQWRAFVAKAAPIYDDKWGPALVVEVTGTAASKIKKRAGRAGTRDRVWVAMGMASS